ncbi:hypothetical protein WAI453_001043 [Rhynchosporium graminicola]|uniref:Uncharacterized protein n=1 Tax=Rhynchosporium graminicola TaxID=2792576 RepID=A0A1E1K671_9HELO|nr:uncharacterized protein RCO7_10570 [Rhynchosporium commune]
MGELHGAVSSLLDAFARGIAIITAHRKRRKNGRIPIDQLSKSAETHLSQSLKQNWTEVRDAYGRIWVDLDLDLLTATVSIVAWIMTSYNPLILDAKKAEARSSLQAIMFRLNAGFVSVIERFTKGRSNSADYEVLLNLSNSSRLEAISAFQQLSHRLSRPSLALPPGPRKSNYKSSAAHRGKKIIAPSSAKHSKRAHHSAKSPSEPSISITPLGPASPDRWVRPKAGRKLSLESRSSGPSTPNKQRSSSKPLAPLAPSAVPCPASVTRTSPPRPTNQSHLPSPNSLESHPYKNEDVSMPAQPHRLHTDVPRADQRESFMSFASDSTKLGEIPEDKWAKGNISEGERFPITPFYPVQPYQVPEKPKSRFMRLFGR